MCDRNISIKFSNEQLDYLNRHRGEKSVAGLLKAFVQELSDMEKVQNERSAKSK